MDTKSFDEQVAALRGKVEPKAWSGLKKSEATPEQWAAKADYGKAAAARYRLTPNGRELERRRQQRYLSTTNGRKRHAASVVRHRERGGKAEYKRRRMASDESFRIAENLRCRLWHASKRAARSGSAVRDLGCSIAELKAHLERQFAPGMTWENWSAGPGAWQIDHVYPLAKADLTDRAQLLAVCNWRNLQPLWFEDNMAKGDTVTPDAQALFDRLRAEFSATAAA